MIHLSSGTAMRTSPLWIPALLSFAILPAAKAGLVVELEQIDDVPAQNSGTAFSAPWSDGVDVYYTKRDDSSEHAPPHGIYRNGALLVASGDEIDEAQIGISLVIRGLSGGSYLMSAYANYMPGEPNSYYTGIHLMPAGQRILDRTTEYPGYPSPLPRDLVGPATFDGGKVAFLIQPTDITPAQPASILYWQGGNITKIATKGDPIPDSASTFSDFERSNLPYAEGGKVVFAGRGSGAAGIYEWDGSGLRTIVNNSTPAPQGGVLGFSFNQSRVVKSGTDYAFVAGNSDQYLYKIADGQLSLVASNQTAVPGSGGTLFRKFSDPTIRDGKVVFLAWQDSSSSPSLEYGIYTDLGGTVEPIVDLRTDFGGRTPESFSINPGHAWVGDAVYFQVAFDDDTDAIYKATFGVLPTDAGPTAPPSNAMAIAQLNRDAKKLQTKLKKLQKQAKKAQGPKKTKLKRKVAKLRKQQRKLKRQLRALMGS